MILIKALFLFVLGSALGSFTNVLVDRGQKGKSLLGRSRCDFCQKELTWKENIPIAGFFLVRGKCKSCGKKLSWQYPVVEAAMGLLFLLAGFVTGFAGKVGDFQLVAQTSFYLFIVFLSVAILVWDLKYMIIPNFLVGAGLIVAVGYELIVYFGNNCSLFNAGCGIGESLLGAIIVGGFFYLMHTLSKGRYIGGGDVKLGFLLGFIVGWEMSYAFLLIAYVLGAIVAVYLLATRKKGMKSQIPFGPFLVASGLLVLFFGGKMVEWYQQLVGSL